MSVYYEKFKALMLRHIELLDLVKEQGEKDVGLYRYHAQYPHEPLPEGFFNGITAAFHRFVPRGTIDREHYRGAFAKLQKPFLDDFIETVQLVRGFFATTDEKRVNVRSMLDLENNLPDEYLVVEIQRDGTHQGFIGEFGLFTVQYNGTHQMQIRIEIQEDNTNVEIRFEAMAPWSE